MIKKGVLFLFVTCLCLLSACGVESKVSGKVIEANIDDTIGVVSFVVQTDADQEIGILMTDETYISSFADGITADEFKTGSFSKVIVSIEYENLRHSITTKNNQEIAAYNAKQIQITDFLTGETILSDGTNIDIWNSSYGSAYTLQNGTELLRIHNPSGPNNVYVAGIESFDDLEKNAQSNVLKFYDNQGLLYDVQADLEKAYDDYLEKEDSSEFNSYMISQDIAPTASNEMVLYFLTSVQLTKDDDHGYEYRTGAAFDRKTGQEINNWNLFSCSPEEAKQKILDIAGVTDTTLRKEMEMAFKPEYIILFPSNLEVCFQQGTLTSQENSYILGLDYDDKLCEILNQWAIPKSSE
ncbi:hypothetical protein RZO55_15450 [Clostridium boliviensis]|uniref:DUF3298 domain-containing protein n=1 Tax=Clostridium boliviensis TaxID=318465 RepID=A0ABU4GMY5_9CLOT|nr:hypothetical protein [Clostridium boliviensis]MDW2798970.1 hypothetical protein [Clostridium boliviensis]